MAESGLRLRVDPWTSDRCDVTQSRTEARGRFDVDVRVALLETDADTLEREVSQKLDAQNRKLNYITGIGVTILLSLIGSLFIIAFR